MAIGAALGAVATPAYNFAIGKATTVQDVLVGAIAGAGAGGLAAVSVTAAAALTVAGAVSGGALVFDVWSDPGTTWPQRIAASALLIAAVAGPAAAGRYAGRVWPRPPSSVGEFKVIHDNGVSELIALYRGQGFQVQTEVYARNPFYSIGRRYDFVVRTPEGEYVAFEYKSTQGALAKYPGTKQALADGYIDSQGGQMFGASADKAGFAGQTISKVIVLGPN